MSGNAVATTEALQHFITALNPVELYTFSCADFAKENRIPPKVGESFLGPLQISNPDIFSCHPSGQGITPSNFHDTHTISKDTMPLIESENTVSSLIEHITSMEDPGFSIELWFFPSSVNDTILGPTNNGEETKCHRLDAEECEYFAKSTYIQGPIACSWYEREGGDASLTHAYCGFPGNRFSFNGSIFDPWIPPFQKCNDLATSKQSCERSHFFAPIPCYWEEGNCQPYEPDSMSPVYPRHPLVSIAEGHQTTQDRNKGCPGTGHNYDFRMVQKGRSFTVSHSGYDKWTCNYSYNPMEMMLARRPELTQVVITMDDTV